MYGGFFFFHLGFERAEAVGDVDAVIAVVEAWEAVAAVVAVDGALAASAVLLEWAVGTNGDGQAVFLEE